MANWRRKSEEGGESDITCLDVHLLGRQLWESSFTQRAEICLPRIATHRSKVEPQPVFNGVNPDEPGTCIPHRGAEACSLRGCFGLSFFSFMFSE